MSLKSFDKFCENMIMSEPGSQKEVFDERQMQSIAAERKNKLPVVNKI